MDRDDQPLMDRSYGYTLAGDIEDINDAVNAVNYSYTYDRLHRLVGEAASAPVETTPMVIDFIYDDDAKPLHAAAAVKVNGRIQENITYDANGNMSRGWNLAEPESVKPRNIEYNADNMPVSVANGDAETRFIYDAEGSRARKRSKAGSTYYFGDHFEYIKGTPTRYVFAGSLRIAKVTPCKIHYFHKDHLGSSTVISTASGKKEDVESTAYLPYGGQRRSDGISRSSYRFTDQEFDGETGLYNFDARLYDPVTGLFVSADSIVPDWYDPQQLIKYSYCRNNPLRYVDPDGQKITFAPGLTDKQKLIILGYMQRLTSDRLLYKGDEIKIKSFGRGKIKGTKLIRRLRTSLKKVEIGIGSSGNTESDDNPTDATSGTGSNTKVSFDPTSNPSIPTKDPTTGNISNITGRPHQIGLGHELIHADRSMRGEAIDYSEMDNYTYKNSTGRNVTQNVPKEELATIGLKHFTVDDITENDLRYEQGENDRGAY